ncbi:unnamed protein product [Ixodes persulcatus]
MGPSDPPTVSARPFSDAVLTGETFAYATSERRHQAAEARSAIGARQGSCATYPSSSESRTKLLLCTPTVVPASAAAGGAPASEQKSSLKQIWFIGYQS